MVESYNSNTSLTHQVVVCVSDDPDCRVIECSFLDTTNSLENLTAISSLLALGEIPKLLVVKNNETPTIVKISPGTKWDIRELANEICFFLEDKNLTVKKIWKTKNKAG
jgi:hypothetical protein